ncbi:MAG: Bax inhibitor-1/YccA family protein [Alphaproteobacteria bacterium]|nr:Bax inhibitor-1/YccA family protein [Alphaproteobacteria bacterium]
MEYINPRSAHATEAVAYDEGLRAYMIKVYNLMAIALAVTGVVAFGVSSSEALIGLIFNTPLKWVVMFAPLVFVIVFSMKIDSMSPSAAQATLWAFSAVMGVSMSWIFLAYTGASIAKVFFITASMFGAMSLYGYTTKRDLTGMGSFLFMGLIGIILASIVNIFLASPGLDFAISIIAVIVFVGLTAYDTQRIKSMYYYSTDGTTLSRFAVRGALSLYMDFINLFIQMLRFFGERR